MREFRSQNRSIASFFVNFCPIFEIRSIGPHDWLAIYANSERCDGFTTRATRRNTGQISAACKIPVVMAWFIHQDGEKSVGEIRKKSASHPKVAANAHAGGATGCHAEKRVESAPSPAAGIAREIKNEPGCHAAPKPPSKPAAIPDTAPTSKPPKSALESATRNDKSGRARPNSGALNQVV